MLNISCEDAQKSMEGGNDAGEKMIAISEPIASDVAVTINQPQAHPSETGEQNSIGIVNTLVPTYPKGVGVRYKEPRKLHMT